MMWCIVIYLLVMISNNYDHRNFQLYTLRREEMGYVSVTPVFSVAQYFNSFDSLLAIPVQV